MTGHEWFFLSGSSCTWCWAWSTKLTVSSWVDGDGEDGAIMLVIYCFSIVWNDRHFWTINGAIWLIYDYFPTIHHRPGNQKYFVAKLAWFGESIVDSKGTKKGEMHALVSMLWPKMEKYMLHSVAFIVSKWPSNIVFFCDWDQCWPPGTYQQPLHTLTSLHHLLQGSSCLISVFLGLVINKRLSVWTS